MEGAFGEAGEDWGAFIRLRGIGEHAAIGGGGVGEAPRKHGVRAKVAHDLIPRVESIGETIEAMLGGLLQGEGGCLHAMADLDELHAWMPRGEDLVLGGEILPEEAQRLEHGLAQAGLGIVDALLGL
jgi:hypothetical protein